MTHSSQTGVLRKVFLGYNPADEKHHQKNERTPVLKIRSTDLMTYDLEFKRIALNPSRHYDVY